MSEQQDYALIIIDLEGPQGPPAWIGLSKIWSSAAEQVQGAYARVLLAATSNAAEPLKSMPFVTAEIINGPLARHQVLLFSGEFRECSPLQALAISEYL